MPLHEVSLKAFFGLQGARQVTIDGKKKYIGLFSTLDEALAARDKLPGYSKKQLEHPEESI
jgi:hypothetical protein